MIVPSDILASTVAEKSLDIILTALVIPVRNSVANSVLSFTNMG